METPWKWKFLEPEVNQKLLELIRGEPEGHIEVGPKRYVYQKRFAEEGFKYYGFQPRASDTWVITFPRSGTTLMQELVWLLSNKLDYKTAAEIKLPNRFPLLESQSCVSSKLSSELINEQKSEEDRNLLLEIINSSLETLENWPGKRFIKTHVPFSLLHPDLLNCGAKVIYVARNPKDVAISYYYLHRLWKVMDYQGTFDQFWDLFQQGKLQWGPYWEHINEAWTLRDNPNLLFLFYEDVQRDIITSIRKIDRFLGSGTDEAEFSTLAQHLDISNFRNNPAVNCEFRVGLGLLNDRKERFIRSGGAPKLTRPEFSAVLNQQADEWIEKNLKNTSLRFPI